MRPLFVAITILSLALSLGPEARAATAQSIVRVYACEDGAIPGKLNVGIFVDQDGDGRGDRWVFARGDEFDEASIDRFLTLSTSLWLSGRRPQFFKNTPNGRFCGINDTWKTNALAGE